MTKEIWRQKWLDSINELTSIDLQKQSWLDNSNTNPHWTFVEFMSCYFDDLFFDDSYYEHYIDIEWVSRQEYEIIKDWHTLLDKYDAPKNDDYDHKSILADNHWLEIVKLGVVAKNKLAQILNPNEKKYLTAEINYLDLPDKI